MNTTSFRIRAVTTFAVLCMPALASAAAPAAPATDRPVLAHVAPAPTAAITPDMLTGLRAPARVDGSSYYPVQTASGFELAFDGTADQGSATRALRKAFPVLTLCQEWAYDESAAGGPRFPFAVEANERLVDALDKLKQNSKGFMQWMLLHERIVVSAQLPADKGEVYIMDRPIHVEIEADTLEQALEQVEAAYNKQYPDAPPFFADPMFPHLLLKGPPAVSGQTGKFVLKKEDTLREVVLALLDEMQDPALRYGLADVHIGDRHFFDFVVKRYDAPILSESLPEGEDYAKLRQSSQQRLDGYLATRAERAAASADKAPAGETKP